MWFAAVAMPQPADAAPSVEAACAQALAYEKAAANDSVTRQAAYDAAVAGLSANQRCTDSQMKLVNEAYLLSMRAPAAHELRIGNWQRDFARANMLLTQCANWPGLRGTKAGFDCTTQQRYNELVAKTLANQPTPRPSAPAPAASGALPMPVPPTPSRPPTRPR